jgi:glucosyl-dolichyl phosphate glucuronosyltransferase
MKALFALLAMKRGHGLPARGGKGHRNEKCHPSSHCSGELDTTRNSAMSYPDPFVTVLVCTYNRARDLEEMLESALHQEEVTARDYEVLVVDNNSSDSTPDVVAGLIQRQSEHLRYLFEPRQGKSFALNTGIEHARGEYYAVIDDDLIMPPTYVRDLIDTIRESAGVAAVAGKVLPMYEAEPPSWLTSEHWAPIAMADLGEEPFRVGIQRPVCLMAATLRRADVLAVGGYRTDLGVRGRDVIGGTEDAELMQRLWQAGHQGMYVPHLLLHHKVPSSRLTTRHFRRWHFGHGRARARTWAADVERSRGRLFDLPLHMYRTAITDVLGWLRGTVTRRGDVAFHHLFQLYFFAGFLHERTRRERGGAADHEP